MGGRLRLEAFEKSAAAVVATREMVVTSLCRCTWEHVLKWMGGASACDDPEAPVRVAVVRPGFCEGVRSWAIRRARRACEAADKNVVWLRWEGVHHMERELGRAGKQTVVVVEDIERCDNSQLCDLLLGAASFKAIFGVALIAASHWSVPSTLPSGISSRVFAREFALPSFEAFAEAMMTQLVVRSAPLPILVGPKVVAQWLESLLEQHNVRAFMSQIKFSLFMHFFKQPNAFAAMADSVDVAASEISDEAECSDELAAALLYRQIARFAIRMTETALRIARSSDLKTTWMLAVSCLDDPTEASRAVRRALRLLDSQAPARTCQLCALLNTWREEWTRIIMTDPMVQPLLLAPIETSPFAKGAATAVRHASARLIQLEAVAERFKNLELDKARRDQLDANILDLYDQLAQQAPTFPTLHLGRLAYFDDAPASAKPFSGKMWSAAIEALRTSTQDIRCLAYQVVSDEMNVDLKRWYKLLQPKKADTIHEDGDADDAARSCEFVRHVSNGEPTVTLSSV